jgi:WhiB family redox-sensing transcriptional regulator
MPASNFVRIFSARQDWFDDAKCAGQDVHLWFSEVANTIHAKQAIFEAKQVCSSCRVRTECLDWANENDERYGIWGGLTPVERGYRRHR